MSSTIKLTPHILRALAAVQAGQVTRSYTPRGNRLEGPPGVGRNTLDALDRYRLIADADIVGGSQVFGHTHRQALTKFGEDTLAGARVAG